MQLSEMELKKLIHGGETNTVELKVAAPRAVEMAERLCGLANAQGGMIILGVKDAKHEIVGIPDHRIDETTEVWWIGSISQFVMRPWGISIWKKSGHIWYGAQRTVVRSVDSKILNGYYLGWNAL